MTQHHHLAVRTILVALVIPILVTLGAIALMISWLPDLPTPAALHWGPAGTVDRVGNPIELPIVLALIGLPFSSIIGGIIALNASRRPLTAIGKLLAVISLGLPVMLSIGIAGSVASQRGLARAADAPGPGLWLGLGAAVAAVLGVAAWFIMPKAASIRSADRAQTVLPLTLASGERATWLRTATTGPAFTWAYVLLVLILFGTSALAAFTSRGVVWPVVIISVVVLLLVIGTVSWTVRVDADGLTLRGIFGLPRIRIPLADVASVDVIDVQPLTQFGGWGIRFGGGGRLGIILRSGEALEVVRRSGRSVVVTVNDAESAAALLGGLVARENASGTAPGQPGAAGRPEATA